MAGAGQLCAVELRAALLTRILHHETQYYYQSPSKAGAEVLRNFIVLWSARRSLGLPRLHLQACG